MIQSVKTKRLGSFFTRSSNGGISRFPEVCLALGAATLMFLSAPRAEAQRPLGIDVSSYQGTPSWGTVKSNGVVFAWAKATQGGSIIDPDFTYNENNGKAAGVIMGAYHFAQPNDNAPGTEASYFWSEAGGYVLADGKTLTPMLDMEVFSGSVGASSVSAWADDWCTDIVGSAASGGVSVKPAIYVSECNACDFDTSVSGWGADIANYNGQNLYTGNPWGSPCPSCQEWGSGVWNFWQVSDTGAVGGISGNVDLDTFNGTSSTLSAWIATAAASSIYYWDPQGTAGANPYTGSMTGTWENNDWSTSSAGQASPTAWVDGKAACFGVHTGNGTPAFTVTMNSDHVVAGFFDGALTPDACNVTLSGTGTINLASGAQALDVHNASDGSSAIMTINNVIAGDGQLVPEGNGQAYLNGANTYNGGTQIGYSGNGFSGIVYFNNGSSFGSGTISLTTYGSGGALVAQGSGAITIPNAVTVANSTTNNIVGTTAGVTYSGSWSMGGNLLTFETGNTAGKIDIISGVMSGTAGLTVSDAGTLELTGINTYSGNTAILSPAVFTIGGAGQLGSGSYAGNIANGGTFNYTSTAAQSLSGNISGAGPIYQTAGTLTLTGNNANTGGITLTGGVVAINADSGLGATSSGLTLNGGCLKNNNSAPVLSASRTITLGVNGGYVDAGWAPSQPVTVNSKITGSGQLLINLDGSPVVLGNTGNNFSGGITIGANGPGYYAPGSQAWLKCGASGVIPNGAAYGDVTVNGTYLGMLDLAGTTQTINGLGGTGLVNNTTNSGAISVGNNNASSTFAGTIENTGGILTVSKIGTGSLTLSGANTYTGPTYVTAGTLNFLGGSLASSAVTVSSGATLANGSTNAVNLGQGGVTFASGALAAFTAQGGASSVVGAMNTTGNLTLAGNTITVTVSGAPLAAGTYRLISCSGAVSGSASANPQITGIGLASGYTATVVTTAGSGGHLDLYVDATPVFSGLAPSPSTSYGTSSIVLDGIVGSTTGPTSVYAPNGDTVTATINGHSVAGTVSGSGGAFSIVYNDPSLKADAVSGSPYTIQYGYAGNAGANLNGAGNSATALSLTRLPVVLTGTRPYNGSATVSNTVLSVSNAVGSDVVTVAAGAATLASANVGTQPITSFGTLALGGAAAGNYTLTGATGAVTITAPPSISISSASLDSTGSNMIITWQSTPGATYHIAAATDISLALSVWSNVSGPIDATATVTSATNALNQSRSYFEVESP